MPVKRKVAKKVAKKKVGKKVVSRPQRKVARKASPPVVLAGQSRAAPVRRAIGGRTSARPPKREALAAATPVPSVASLAVLGLSELNLTEGEAAAIVAPWPDEAIEILPTKEVYIPHTFFRQRLTTIFGPGGWGMSSGPATREGRVIIQEWVLMIRGVAVGKATGYGSYNERNPHDNWSNAVESTQSRAISRICGKQLGMATFLASRRWQFNYLMANGVLVRYRRNTRDGSSIVSGWRHVDGPPLEGEVGIDDSSPNADRYKTPTAARRAAAYAYAGEGASGSAEWESPDVVSGARAALVAADDERIGTAAKPHRQIQGAMKQHGVTDDEVREHIRTLWGHTSMKDILRSQVVPLIDWIRSPGRLRPDEDEPLEPELV